MNNVYIYDGDFYSLLCLIYKLIKINTKVNNIKKESDFIPDLFSNPVKLNLNDKKKNINLLEKNSSKKVLDFSYNVFLSSYKEKELVIYYFIKNSIKYKNEIFFHRELNSVNIALKLSQKVSREAHKIKGFLRFKKMKNNFYYAEINPTNNVLKIVSNHFKTRLKNEYFIIKDVNRNIYALYDLKKIIYLKEENIKKLNLDLSIDELNMEDLWKSFYKTIGIKERENKKCRMNFMPKKYWKYILEMEEEL